MNGFQLRVHLNGEETSVTAHRRRSGYVVETPAGPASARNVHEASRLTAKIVGPILQRAQVTGSAWGLHLHAGDAQALFGEWVPAATAPQFVPTPEERQSPISQIFDRWQRRDGSPLGALEAATKIIEIYTERYRARAA